MTRRERWGLSWRGWLVVFLISLSAFLFALLNIHSYLAVTDRTDANILVVEGWIHEYAIQMAVKEFHTNSYEMVYTTGGPVEGTSSYINDYNTSASVGADLLKKWGLPKESLQMVPSRVIDRDRTYNSAVALRNWFLNHETQVRRINVMTEDVHARRTRLLFEKAFGSEVEVGIIAARNPDYDAAHWWRSSEGFRDVVGEAIAYFYAKVFFLPKTRTASISPGSPLPANESHLCRRSWQPGGNL
jgi:uncharacterized SAM-binding protein YcdF (DUF218 family)